MTGWEDSIPSREPPPEEEAIRREEAARSAGPSPRAVDEKTLGKIWRDMRRLKPHLFVVTRAWVEGVSLRDEPTRYSSGLYRGFYAEHSRKLGITENAVKHRLTSGVRWFAERVRKTCDVCDA